MRVADLFKEVEDQIRIKELKISQEVSKLELKLINLTPKHNELENLKFSLLKSFSHNSPSNNLLLGPKIPNTQ